ncbi:MAG: YtxH domain-containing protein [Gemmatimonadota bacterium]
MSRDDREVFYVERDQGGGAFKWLLIGAALGAGAALLFAPRTGTDLRKELGKGIKRLRSIADDTIQELEEEPDTEEDKLRAMSDEAWEGEGEAEEDEDLDEDLDEGAVAARPSRSEEPLSARQELERRLEAARARRRRKPALNDDEEPGT